MFPLIWNRPARGERAMTRWNEPFWDFRQEMENLFDRFFEGARLPAEWNNQRDWEVNETDKEVVMRLDIPGFEATAFDLRIEGNVFVVRAEHPERKEDNGHRHM